MQIITNMQSVCYKTELYNSTRQNKNMEAVW